MPREYKDTSPLSRDIHALLKVLIEGTGYSVTAQPVPSPKKENAFACQIYSAT
jgi:hypothetical protein